jgi:hypothetical protein
MRSAQSLLAQVTQLPSNQAAQATLARHGLRAYRVTWEDTARNKGSSVGPNISDMTLCAKGQDLPIIRRPNFEDLTFDVPHERIELTVGNEHGEALRKVSLKQYLQHLDHYLHAPLELKGAKSTSFWTEERDKNVLAGAQACMLPVGLKDGEMTDFTVALRNYQSSKDAPAVLVLVSSDQGTSAHVINTSGKEQLYFNKDGQRCALLGERLGAMRRREGRPDDGAPMTAEERAKNLLLIIQVPLKRKETHYGSFSFGVSTKKGNLGFSFDESAPSPGGFSFGGTPKDTQFDFWDEAAPSQMKQWEQEMECASNVALPDDDDDDIPEFAGAEGWSEQEDSMDLDSLPLVKTIERAMVHVGPPLGPYDELCGQGPKLERDARFPIRVTLQFYFATTTGHVDAAFAKEVDEQFLTAQRFFGAVAPESSLVNQGDTKRSTEMRPAWWTAWLGKYWGQVQGRYPKGGAEEAAAIVFKNGRFVLEANLSELVAQEVLAILEANGE